MSDLQNALDFLDEVNNSHSEQGLTGGYVEALLTVVEAARLVTNPNIQAAAEKFVDCDSALATDLTGWDRKLWAAEQAVAAALTPGDTDG